MFQLPFAATVRKEITAWELGVLLGGIDLSKGRRRKRYTLPEALEGEEEKSGPTKWRKRGECGIFSAFIFSCAGGIFSKEKVILTSRSRDGTRNRSNNRISNIDQYSCPYSLSLEVSMAVAR
jgi:hypothetical protein